MKSIQRNRIVITFTIMLLWVQVAGLNRLVFAQEVGSNGKAAVSKEAMATTAHPLATEAAIEMLKQGGNAIDAAVAAAFAIGVVEPDGSGLGGGGGMVIYLAKERKPIYINYYQRASADILDLDYNPQSDARSAKAVLVPGTVAGLTTALEKYGRLSLSKVLEPAIRYASQGFPVDETLAKIMLDNSDFLQKYPSTANIFLNDGFPMMQGDTLLQAELAQTLRLIAQNGRAGFYEGEVAKTMVNDVTKNGGMLSLQDLKNYQPVITEPLKGSYRGYDILTANTPQSGSSILEGLNILENANLASMGHYSTSVETMHLMAEAIRRVYADRGTYLDDPKFESVPVQGLISKSFALTRYNDIDMTSVQPPEYRKTKAGNPNNFGEEESRPYSLPVEKDTILESDDVDEERGSNTRQADDMFNRWGSRRKRKSPATILLNDSTSMKTTPEEEDTTKLKKVEQERPQVLDMRPMNGLRRSYSANVIDYDTYDGGHTTHLSVVDKEGNAVSLTQTLGTFFGSGLTTAGVVLNCGMSNFSITTAVNSAKPNKQPRSSISPTIILKNGKPFLTVGSPGATRIIATVIELIINVIDFKMPVDEANNAPRFLCQKNDDYLSLESRISQEVQDGLTKKGHHLKVYGDLDLFFGGAQMILYNQETQTFYGSADPRRGGVAIGD